MNYSTGEMRPEPGPANAARWRAIRAVALELFEQEGFASVSISQIAETAGVSRRTFFNYFPTKSAVLFDPAPTEAETLRALLDSHSGCEDRWLTVTRAISDYLVGQSQVLATRRRILASDPTLAVQHLIANVHFEDTLVAWLNRNGTRGFSAQILCAVVLAVVRKTFTVWDPESGSAGLEALLQEGFDLVADDAAWRVRDTP